MGDNFIQTNERKIDENQVQIAITILHLFILTKKKYCVTTCQNSRQINKKPTLGQAIKNIGKKTNMKLKAGSSENNRSARELIS